MQVKLKEALHLYIGQEVLYAGKIVTIKEINKTHALISFKDGRTLCVSIYVFSKKDLIINKY